MLSVLALCCRIDQHDSIIWTVHCFSCFWLDEIKRVIYRYTHTPHMVSLFLNMDTRHHPSCHRYKLFSWFCHSSAVQHLDVQLGNLWPWSWSMLVHKSSLLALPRKILLSEPGTPRQSFSDSTSLPVYSDPSWYMKRQHFPFSLQLCISTLWSAVQHSTHQPSGGRGAVTWSLPPLNPEEQIYVKVNLLCT